MPKIRTPRTARHVANSASQQRSSNHYRRYGIKFQPVAALGFPEEVVKCIDHTGQRGTESARARKTRIRVERTGKPIKRADCSLPPSA